MKRRLTVAALAATALLAALLTSTVPSAQAAPAANPTPTPSASTKPSSPSGIGAAKVIRKPSSVQYARAKPMKAPPALTTTVPKLDTSLYGAAGVSNAATPAGVSAVAPDESGSVAVTVSGPKALTAADAAGEVLATAGGLVSALVPADQLRTLAATAGVALVAPSRRAYSLATPSQAVTTSNAKIWINAGSRGAGVKVAIVDASFGGLAAEVKAGNLPAGLTVPAAQNHCGTHLNDDNHGTAVAEIVHQMAPAAQLYLYCISDNVGFSQAETQLQDQGVKVVNSSLGFAADGRGDGTGVSNGQYISTALTVKRAHDADILWFQSAGNSAQDHWTGALVNSDPGTPTENPDAVDLFASAATVPAHQDYDMLYLDPGTSGEVALSWDQWPSSSSPPPSSILPINVSVMEYDVATGRLVASYLGQADPGSPAAPARFVDLDNSASGPHYNGNPHFYVVRILRNGATLPTGAAAIRYDLTYLGDFYSSLRAEPSIWIDFPAPDGHLIRSSDGSPSRAANGSMLEPASSPFVVAVGAVYYGTSQLEPFSSRGPTIDGRTKPDLLGQDGVSSNVPGESPFYGTSSASPHAAGAAALIFGTDRTLTADQVLAQLKQRAHGGVVNLDVPTGARYTALPVTTRILDTRTALGGHQAPLVANREIAVPVPANLVPADASAVVINLTGAYSTSPGYLAAYPDTYANTSNVNLTVSDRTAAAAAVVSLNSKHGFKLRTSAKSLTGIVDVVGYFGPKESAANPGLGYVALTPSRILDTRYGVGVPIGRLGSGRAVTVHVAGHGGVPTGAKAVMVNLTATSVSGSGYLSAYTGTFRNLATLNYLHYTRANLAVVNLDAAGNFTLRNQNGLSNAVVDVLGYFSPSATGGYISLGVPVRMVDTRTAPGPLRGPLATGRIFTVQAGGKFGVPAKAKALWTGITAVPVSGNGVVNVYPAGTSPPLSSTLNFTPHRVVPNAAVVALSAGGAFSTRQTSGTGNIVEDLFGYFVP
ncbi:MAG: hypothetical protein JWN95_800 [Frankiales bacterium]|nr:hypothetical protein [Frankiales bacterium]